MAKLYRKEADGRHLAKHLAEAIILQALEDIWCDKMKWECMAFFTGDGFNVCADIISMTPDERHRVLRLAKKALDSSVLSMKERTFSAQKDGFVTFS